MNWYSRAFWIAAIFCFLIFGFTRFILGAWIPFLYVPVFLGFILCALAVAFDYKILLEFLTLKTTRNGLNMGTAIVLFVLALFLVNYLIHSYDFKADLTQESLNSLSPQSVKVLKSYKKPLTIKVFYRGQEDEQSKDQVSKILDLYKDESSKLKIDYINSRLRPDLAQEYLSSLAETSGAVVFVESSEAKIRVEEPVLEEQSITTAIVKATRQERKVVYFLRGHGEGDISDSQSSLKPFADRLKQNAFVAQELNLIRQGSIPEDASAIAIVRPVSEFHEPEIDLLKNYLKNGGSIFLALDPNYKHGLNSLLKFIGVDYKSNFIFDPQMQWRVLGAIFDKQSPITKSFPQNFTVFELVSEVVPLSKPKKEGFFYRHLVRSPFAAPVEDLSKTRSLKRADFRPTTLALEVQGSLSESKKEFKAVVVGDSDFLLTPGVGQGLNLNFAFNSMAFLAGENDLVSIPPKKPKGTKFFLTSIQKKLIILFGISLPLILAGLGVFLWYRNRDF